jgi:hypothetical protein
VAHSAEVYRGRDTRLNRNVAIAVFVERFTERCDPEAHAIASPVTTLAA